MFLIMRRTDIPSGTLQVVDLWPNTSSKNYAIDPGLGQTGYLHNIPVQLMDGNVAAGPPVVALTDLSGVGAYLIGNIDTGAAPGAPFTGLEADTAVGGLVSAVLGGTALDLTAVDAILGAVVAGTTLTGGGSTGVLSELLSVLAGNVYQIPSGTDLSDGGGLFAGRVGDFVTGTYTPLYDIGRFKVSNLNGNISLLKSASFTYDNALGVPTAGAAVGVYDETGTVFP
jgi:hypothetical protein